MIIKLLSSKKSPHHENTLKPSPQLCLLESDRFPDRRCFSLFLFIGCCEEEPIIIPTVKTVEIIVRPSTLHDSNGKLLIVVGKIVSDGGGVILEKGLCISRNPNPTINDEKKPGLDYDYNDSSLFSEMFYIADPNEVFYVRAYAINEIGIGYGEVVEFYNSALAFVQTGNAEVLSNTEATLRATVDARNSQVEIWFEVWRDGEAIRRVDIQKTGAQSATEIFATTVSLTPGEVYSYVVKAKNDAGITTGETKTFRLYYEQVSDYDGNNYLTVKIGDQIWLAENLRTKHFLNGDAIPNVQPDNEWVAMRSPAWCYTKNDPKLGEIYGCLYNNYVGLDPRGLIAGYHTPSIQEYETLVGYLGGGTTAARKLKSATDDWCIGGKGDNASGFNALPGGWRSDRSTPFTTLSYQACFQTTTPMEGVGVYYSAIVYGSNRDVMTIGANYMYVGYSIRLIKN